MISRGSCLTNKVILSICTGVFITGCSVTPHQISSQESLEKGLNHITQLKQQSEPVSGKISLNEAIARALKYNHDRKLQSMAQALEQGQLDLNNFDMLPKLVTNAGYSQRNNYAASASTTFINGEPAPLSDSPAYSVSQDKKQTAANIAFTWDALDFGLSYVRAKQQANRYLIAKENERKVEQNIIQDVRNAYYRSASAQRLLSKIDPLVEKAQSALSDAEKIEKTQARSPVDALNYQRELLETLRTLQTLRQDLMTAKPELAVLMGLLPGEQFELTDATDEHLDVPSLHIDMQTMEHTALTKRPEILESEYKQRVSLEETHAALLSLLPGISFSAGEYYDNTKYLKNNEWSGLGTQVNWNLFNVFKIGSINKFNELKNTYANEEALATAMAVVSQVHIADIHYLEAQQSYKWADRYLTVSKRIGEQVKISQQVQQVGELELIRENLNTLLAEVRRDIAYADLQNSYGRIFASMGVDVVPEGFSNKSVVELSKEIDDGFQRMNNGSLTPLQADHVEKKS
jgi:Outer membrane protein